jgi:lantibiotic modifying enzyme
MSHVDRFLGGELRVRALRALDDLSLRLVAASDSLGDDPSLALGTSGVAVAHAHLHHAFPDRGHDDIAIRSLEHIFASKERIPRVGWLAGGFSGVGWALQSVARGETIVLPITDEVDAALLRMLRRHDALPWELLQGVAGLAVYALARRPVPSAHDMLESIAIHLCRSVRAGSTGPCWITNPDANPWRYHAMPYVDLGLAHGAPGALTVAAALLDVDIGVAELEPIVRSVSRSLLGYRLPTHPDACFPYFSDDCAAPSRTAWCYGDPGVAWALMVAGRALRDSALSNEALSIAKVAAARTVNASGVADHAFCHGASGLAHIFRRMHQVHPEAFLLEASRRWLSVAIDIVSDDTDSSCHPEKAAPQLDHTSPIRSTTHIGFLDGIAGTALTLLGALNEDITGWDAPLLIA